MNGYNATKELRYITLIGIKRRSTAVIAIEINPEYAKAWYYKGVAHDKKDKLANQSRHLSK